MSNSNYSTTASVQPLAPIGLIDADISIRDTLLTYYNLILTTSNDLRVGMGLLIDDEIMALEVITDTTFTVKRGCADTIPTAHDEDAIIWFIDGFIGVDNVPYMGTEQIGVKLLPRTSSGVVDITLSPPLPLTMAQRFIRPYNVGQFQVNAGWWDSVVGLTAIAPNATLTWNERNRVVQADQLVGYADSNVPAEAGTTYRATIFTAGDTQVKVYDGITNGWQYTRAMATHDFNLVPLTDTGLYPMYLLFTAVRDGHTCWQEYRIDMTIDTAALATGIGTEAGENLATEDLIDLILEYVP